VERQGDVVVRDTCPQGGGLSVALDADRPVERSAVFVAPPGTRIAGYELWRSLTFAAPDAGYAAEVVESANGATLGAYGCAPSGPACASAGDPWSPLNRVVEHDRPLDAVALRVGCRLDACDAPPTAPVRAELYRSHVVLDDPAPPAVRRVSGTLTGPDVVSGAGTLLVAATDRGGGIAAVSLSIDGGPERVATSFSDTCEVPYSAAQPCPTEAERAFSVDTSALADGAHTAAGAVIDAAGNTTPWGPVTFTVRHPPQLTLNPDRPPPITVEAAPDNGRPAVHAPLLRLARSAVERSLGSAATLAGTLRTAAGAPVGGARLTVTSRDLGTDADGETTAVIRRTPGVRSPSGCAATVRSASPSPSRPGRARSRPRSPWRRSEHGRRCVRRRAAGGCPRASRSRCGGDCGAPGRRRAGRWSRSIASSAAAGGPSERFAPAPTGCTAGPIASSG